MSSAVTMKTLYAELKSLKRDIQAVKYALLPVERVSAKELKELHAIKKEMEAGKEKSFYSLFTK